MKKVTLSKGDILQRKGDINSKIYKVETGLLRSYTIDDKGKEHIFMFAPSNWIIGESIAKEKPCDLFIDALEDSIVFVSEKNEIPIQDTKKLLKRIEVLQNRIILLMSATAIERYEHFIDAYPDIVQRISQRMIASYLGITPEALSAAKRHYYKNK